MRYTVVLLKEPEGAYSVLVPALPGCATMGDDVPEALDMAKDAIRCHLAGLAKEGIAPPPDAEGLSIAAEDWGEATEALVYRVTIATSEEVAVA
jgi:predicted RNase H-like HicB family nuclease